MLPLVYHSNYSCDFPDDHRFVMSKFRRLYDYLNVKGLILADNVYQPDKASIQDLSIAHSPEYLTQLSNNSMDARQWRRIGLPWSQGLIDRTFTAPNGTLLAARLALKQGMACHLAGGTHHAHYDFGSGFCMINDLAYTANTLIESGEVQRILIFDCDVHQGDGTAAILANQPHVFTCSIHCEKNFPFRKHASDLDVGLDKFLQDDDYLSIIRTTLSKLLDEQQPDLVLYDAGVDIWQHDELGHLDITWDGVAARDEQVLRECLMRHIPVATVIGGGYDKDHDRLAQRHACVIEVAAHLYHQYF
ncbi:histone deacetylase family protein [Bermanella sp. WJH001]|uniref:histone deacetylase family protein n=1 Tax=Bermanella sp. WJH001 TaxID=3048005 RepID=UPI0024BE3FBD|nr:histone deacetylase [Bermanella sp. WJH001]MDJ1537814.1 histone deacetylase [Bermanella sp. WJH001]